MSPFFGWIIAETTARTMLEMLTWQCHACGRRQAVPKEKLMAEVECERCGAQMPPRPVPKR